jgi:hypothetical protein
MIEWIQEYKKEANVDANLLQERTNKSIAQFDDNQENVCMILMLFFINIEINLY